MIDYLFVSPLGWSEHVWDKLTTLPKFRTANCDYVTFLDDSFPAIEQEVIEAELLKKLTQLSPQGLVVASSYGSLVTLSTLAKHQVSLPRLVLIAGLMDMPSLTDLAAEFEKDREELYASPLDYLSVILTDKERKDSLLCQIVLSNLQAEGTFFRSRLSLKNPQAYLAAYAGAKPQDLLEQVSQRCGQLIIFSDFDLPYPYIKIAPEDHLLMLTKPHVLYQTLLRD